MSWQKKILAYNHRTHELPKIYTVYFKLRYILRISFSVTTYDGKMWSVNVQTIKISGYLRIKCLHKLLRLQLGRKHKENPGLFQDSADLKVKKNTSDKHKT